MSEVKVNKISPRSGTDVTLGDASDTFTVPSSATLTVASGGTLSIASGATLTNAGTATGFPEYDDSVLQSNVAMLGFKVAVNGSLTRYNLVDQSIDEFYDTSGVDASASTNEQRVASGSNYYYDGAVAATPPSGGDSTDTSISGYTSKIFSSTGTGTLTVNDAGDVDVLVVAGGGSGGFYFAGGGGAGGLVYKTGVTLVGSTTYDAIVGAGGATKTSNANGHGNIGTDSTFGENGETVLFTAKGGGGGGDEGDPGQDGGSGGGASYITGATDGGDETQTGQAGDSGTYGFGGDGPRGYNNAPTWSTYYPAGGGGAGGAAVEPTGILAGNGGIGKDYSAIFGTVVGDSGWFASGGGGSKGSAGATPVYGVASAGGGGNGAVTGGSAGSAATANTGGGGGGGGTPNSSPGGNGGAGGSGVVIVRWADSEFVSVGDLTLQSTDVTAESSPTYGEFVTLIENAYGTATLNTDIKGYVSRDSGVTFTQGTLLDEGSWGTNKQILGFHDLTITGSAGTSMCYKITTHNQVGASKETRIYATSIGWR